MSTRFKFISIIAVMAIVALLITILVDIKNTYLALGSIKTELTQVKQDFSNYKMSVQKVNEIDNKFTEDLANAKAENNKLHDDVINGLGRLQLNIDKAPNATTTSMDDANACELTGEARQNYYLLRDDIITKDNMILGLQNYIKNICLAD